MAKRIMALLMAMSFLSLAWLGTTAWGQEPQARRGLSLTHDTPITAPQITELLVQKGVITPQDKARLDQGDIPSPHELQRISVQSSAG
ncbi:MAG: hypothetical protein ACRERE_29625 [Candidatus Entotheonellia bacterium]